MRITALIALAIVVTACSRNSNGPAQNQPTAPTNESGDVIQTMNELSDRQRNAVFIRAIRDAGLECQHVDWSTLSGDRSWHAGVDGSLRPQSGVDHRYWQ